MEKKCSKCEISKPVSSFNPDTPMCIVNSLSNLQPLWGPDNIRKSDT